MLCDQEKKRQKKQNEDFRRDRNSDFFFVNKFDSFGFSRELFLLRPMARKRRKEWKVIKQLRPQNVKNFRCLVWHLD